MKLIRYREYFQCSPSIKQYFCLDHAPKGIGFEASAIMDEVELNKQCSICLSDIRQKL